MVFATADVHQQKVSFVPLLMEAAYQPSGGSMSPSARRSSSGTVYLKLRGL